MGMDFPYALQATYRHFHLSVAATAQPWAMHELVSSLQQPPWLVEHSTNTLSHAPMLSFLLMLAAHLGCCTGRTDDDGDDYRQWTIPGRLSVHCDLRTRTQKLNDTLKRVFGPCFVLCRPGGVVRSVTFLVCSTDMSMTIDT